MKKTPLVGLVWHSYVPYGNDVIRGVADYAARYGPWQFFMSQLGDFQFDEASTFDFDGILLSHDNPIEVNEVRWPRGIPMVSTQRALSMVTPWQVLPDNLAVGRLVAEEFVQRGFRNFAYCPQTNLKVPDATWDPDRLEGFSRVVRENGGEPLVYRGEVGIHGHYMRDVQHPELIEWLRSLPKPVGIMAPSDLRARHVLGAGAHIGMRVPEEVAVIGVNNEPWTEMMFGGISSVELDGRRTGYLAADLLHKLMQGEAVEKELVRVPPLRMVSRRSSDAFAIDDPDVVTAVRFIAEHVSRGIDVKDVVDAVPLSRRPLERRFQRVMKRSILDQIRLAQFTRAEMLLADESLSLERVGKMCGFPTAKAFGAVYRRIVGKTPSAARRALRLAARGARKKV